jgi:hypothetical protein
VEINQREETLGQALDFYQAPSSRWQVITLFNMSNSATTSESVFPEVLLKKIAT